MSNKMEIKLITTDDPQIFSRILAIFSKKRILITRLTMSSNRLEETQEFSIIIETAFLRSWNILPQLEKQISVLNATMNKFS